MRYQTAENLAYSFPSQVDIESAYFDLLINDEELVSEAQKACEDIFYMTSKLQQLDEASPAYEPLCEAMSGGVKIMEEAGKGQYHKAINDIANLNTVNILDDAGVALVICGALTVATGAVLASGGTLALVGSAAAATAAEAGGLASVPYLLNRDEAKAAKQSIDEYLESAKRVHRARDEFEAVWSRMIEDEQPEVAQEN